MVLLIWVYYSAQIVLLGAEFTRAYVEHFGGRPAPSEHATKDPAPEAVGGKKERVGVRMAGATDRHGTERSWQRRTRAETDARSKQLVSSPLAVLVSSPW